MSASAMIEGGAKSGWSPVRAAIAKEDESSLDSGLFPSSESAPVSLTRTGDLRGAIKLFLSDRKLDSFNRMTVELLALPEIPEAIRKDITELISKERSQSQVMLLEDCLASYHVLTSRLPDKASSGTWLQDLSKHHELYVVVGAICSLMRLSDRDFTLTQRVSSPRFEDEGGNARQDLRERLVGYYKQELFATESEFLSSLVQEFSNKNPLAVTNVLKGYLAPLFELEKEVKLSWFKRTFGGEYYEDQPIEEVADLDEAPLSSRHTYYLKQFKKQYQEFKVLPLARIPVPEVIDQDFVSTVLHSSDESQDKVIFLFEAIKRSKCLTEQALDCLSHRVFEYYGCKGDSTVLGFEEVTAKLNQLTSSGWSPSPEEPVIPILAAYAIDRCREIKNTSIYSTACQRIVSNLKLNRYGYSSSFKEAFAGLIGHIIESARSGKEMIFKQ